MTPSASPCDAWQRHENLFVTLRRSGDAPLVAVAVHHGHRIRREVLEHLTLSSAERRREEDPCTAQFTRAAPIGVIALRSRFEVDLNRPRVQAVYGGPDEAWGMELWREPLPADVVERSLTTHDAFYIQMRELLDGLLTRHRRFVVLDLHSYNHRRSGPDGEPDDPRTSPDINVGTGSVAARSWRKLIDRVIDEAARFEIGDKPVSVGENVRFRGGYFPTWVNQNYGDRGCALAIEVKKLYMDEWTGRIRPCELRATVALIGRLAARATATLEEP